MLYVTVGLKVGWKSAYLNMGATKHPARKIRIIKKSKSILHEHAVSSYK